MLLTFSFSAWFSPIACSEAFTTVGSVDEEGFCGDLLAVVEDRAVRGGEVDIVVRGEVVSCQVKACIWYWDIQ